MRQLARREAIATALLLFCAGGLVMSFGLHWPTSAQSQNLIHTVQAGQTLGEIADLYSVTVTELAAFNGLTPNAELFPGQQLFIPPADGDITATPRGSTAGEVDGGSFIFEARPTVPPPTPTLAYDPSLPLTIIDPQPGERFTVGLEPYRVRGTVQFNPKTMLFWKLEILGNRNSKILPADGDVNAAHAAGSDWVTMKTSTETILDGTLGYIPPYPNLSDGSWQMRVVLVAKDGSFIAVEQIPFLVRFRPEQVVLAIVNQPVEGAVIDPDTPIIGSVLLNWAMGSYRVELRGGPYTNWTIIQNVINDPANPITIYDGPLAQLPPDLPEGRYEGRLVVTGLNGDYIQDPVFFSFALGTDNVSNLSLISLNIGNRVETIDTFTLEGTIRLPNDEGYYKLEIIDNLRDGQTPRFTDWTTIGDIRTGSVVNGTVAELPGVFAIDYGDYLVRVVLVNAEGEVIETLQFRYQVRWE